MYEKKYQINLNRQNGKIRQLKFNERHTTNRNMIKCATKFQTAIQLLGMEPSM